jgi:hypothetical protein
MTVSYKGRILVSTTSTGTGALTQVATFTGYSAPAAADDGKTFEISIVAVDGSGTPTGDFEECESVYSHSGTTWSRGRLIRSSTGSRVSFAAGTKRIAVIASESTFAKIGNFVDVANASSSGTGTQADPWIIDSLSPAAGKRYNARTGYYSYSTSPVWAVDGLHLYCEAGVYFQHTGRGVGFDLNNTDALNTFVNGVRISGVNLLGNYATGTGTISTTNGSAAVVGTGTAFTTQLAVGDCISFNPGESGVETRRIATITDNTHLTTEDNWQQTKAGAFTYGMTTDGFYVVGLSNFSIEDCSSRDQGAYALDILASSFGEVHKFQYTIDNPTYHQYYHIKGNGIFLGKVGSGQAITTKIQFFSPSVDHFRNYGIYMKEGRVSTVYDGAFESTASPATAARIDSDGNVFIGTDFEGISGGTGIDVRSYNNQFINCADSISTTLSTGSALQNEFIGGQYKTINDAGGYNVFHNVACTLAGGSGFTALGQFSARFNCQDQNGPLVNIIGFGTALGLDSTNANPLNAARGNTFQFGVSGNITFANPTKAVAGQEIKIAIYSSGAGGWTVAWGSQFRVANGVTLPTTTGATGVIKYVTCVRDYSNSFWDVIQAN